MVRYLLALLLSLAALGEAASPIDPDIRVVTQIEPSSTFEGNTLEGIITVTHRTTQKIDTTSFRLEGKPLVVDLVKEVRISPTDSIVISIYHFQLPGRPRGSHTLPPIHVTIDGQSYESLPTDFDVTGAVAAPSQAPNTARLLLQATVEGPTPLYPGQRAKFIYRYIFTGDIQLVTEKLPLLDAKGFTKIGEKEIASQQEKEVTIQQVTQAVRANKAGEFTFPPSVIEGYAYRERLGKRVMLQPKLRATADPVKVVVTPFPAADKPITFNGAVGQFTLQVTLASSSQVTVDDRMVLAIEISGEDLGTVTVPNLSQSGFLPFFRLSDLPAVGKVTGNTKRFDVDIYPLSSEVKQIPAVLFSYFDPKTAQYVKLRSLAIPITVKPRVAAAPTPAPKKQIITPLPKTSVIVPPPIEIEAHPPLRAIDLKQMSFGTWRILWIIPIGFVLLVAQLLLRNYLMQKQQKEKP